MLIEIAYSYYQTRLFDNFSEDSLLRRWQHVLDILKVSDRYPLSIVTTKIVKQAQTTSKMLQLKVRQIIQETEDVKTFLFQSSDNQRITYKAGQFLTLVFNMNGEEIRRSYSLNSAPNIDAALAISVKRIPNGAVSRYFHDHIHVGDSVQSLLPSGRFVVADRDIEDGTKIYFFVAAGSGITPIFSPFMLKTSVKNCPAL